MTEVSNPRVQSVPALMKKKKLSKAVLLWLLSASITIRILLKTSLHQSKSKLDYDCHHLRQINHEPTRAKNYLNILLTNVSDCYFASTLGPICPPKISVDCSETSDQLTDDSTELKVSDHLVVYAIAPLDEYKALLPQQRKILVRSVKISNTVAAIRELNMIELL